VVELWTLEFHGTRVPSFIGGLDNDRAHDEANALIRLLGVRGNRLSEPRSKSLGDGLFELRGKEVRIFYTFRPGRRIVLLDGMIKRRQDIPKEVLRRLRKLLREVS
jgi:hypothetical protein